MKKRCAVCNTSIDSTAKFCTLCGANQTFSVPTKGKIYIQRKKNVFLCIAKVFKVYIDGLFAGKLYNGTTLVIDAEFGFHELSFVAFGKTELTINCRISIDHPSLSYFARCNNRNGHIELQELYNNEYTNSVVNNVQEIDGLIDSIDDALGEKNDDLYCNAVDPLLYSAAQIIFERNQASVSMLQRQLSIGYSRASRLINTLETIGVISESVNIQPRRILVTPTEFDGIYADYTSCSDKNEATEPSVLDTTFEHIDYMCGAEFEMWCAELLRNSGFENVEISAKSGDQGVDILAERNDITYAIQCKCYSHDLGNTPVQEINTGKVVYNRHIGAVMTNRYFTKGGKDAAAATGILLWDRDKLRTMYEATQK